MTTWSVIITTYNRVTDLAGTLVRLKQLEPAPDEILVCLDGCTDGTRAMLAERFPAVRIRENLARAGSIPSRDRLIRAASGDLILSLDDDSHPIETDFLARAAEYFHRDERLAVLWFPQRSEEFPASLAHTDFGPDTLTGTYTSSGAALRRSAYLSLPGYPPLFGHAYEEPDYALQCIAAGWRIRQHTGLTIRHYYSGRNRNEIRTHHLHARNEQWSVLMRCPAPWWPAFAVARMAGQFRYACRRGILWIVREPLWWWRAVRGCGAAWRLRRPVERLPYERWRKLLRCPETIAPDGK